MNSFIENSLKEFVQKREDIFGIRSEFVGFESSQTDAENSTKGLQSEAIFGCIRYRNENGNILSSPALVLKNPPDPTTSLVAEATILQFVNEIFIYGHILPFFANLETSVLELIPKFYGSFIQTYPQFSQAVILLENLRHSNYQNAPCKSFLNYNHLSLMVRSLGKFHAFSYLAKELDPVHFQTYALSLNPISGPIIGNHPGSLTILGTHGLTFLALQSKYKHFVPIIENLLNKADQILVTVFKKERDNPWAVIRHGDYLSGNVMFKYENGEPTHLKMFDFSSSSLSSPVLDLASLLYLNANQETRDVCFDQLIDDYCDSLSSLPIPIKKLPSRDVIITELQSKAFYAYIIASFFLPFLVAEDLGMGSFHQFLPPKYVHYDKFLELPIDVRTNVILNWGGQTCAQYLADILKDMLKRGFIQGSGLSNIG
ncbi:hypothetical protein V9T40_000657 [Parthenolecanium corni]|uniref:CHK kinase-like domain-containing protein n=1 Tax=Parthenolecanium corni TaxID=536013 RepID=A0AAN9T9Q9_9HEMI